MICLIRLYSAHLWENEKTSKLINASFMKDYIDIVYIVDWLVERLMVLL